MRKIVFKRHVIEVHDDFKQIEIDRLAAFNRYVMLDSGIGSSLSDIDKKISSIISFVSASEKDAAKKEIMALRKLMFFFTEEIDPENLSFACLVKSIDNKEYYDLTSSGLKEVINHLKRIKFTKGILSTHRDEVKKK